MMRCCFNAVLVLLSLRSSYGFVSVHHRPPVEAWGRVYLHHTGGSCSRNPTHHSSTAPTQLYQSFDLRRDHWSYRDASSFLLLRHPRTTTVAWRTSPRIPRHSVVLQAGKNKPDDADVYFEPRTTATLIVGQTTLILVAAALSLVLKTPKFGLGPNISFDSGALWMGGLLSIPLGLLAAGLDAIEDRFPALQGVTRVTQRSVLGLLGGTFKPIIALVVSIVLGVAAGIGEEMLFRGILQYELAHRIGVFLSLLLSSALFGLLHAVTPLYALLASLASLYFGFLYMAFDNLAVPIACHALYDVGALMYAHWTVSRLTDAEKADLNAWDGPGSS